MAGRFAERLAKLEDFCGTTLTDGDLPLVTQIVHLNGAMIKMDETMYTLAAETEKRLTSMLKDLTVLTDAVQTASDGIQAKLLGLEDEIVIIKRAWFMMFPHLQKQKSQSRRLSKAFGMPRNWRTFCGTWSSSLWLFTYQKRSRFL